MDYSVLSWLLGSLLFTGCSRLTSQRPTSHFAPSWPLGIRTSNRSVCLAPVEPVYILFISGRTHQWVIVNIGEKVPSTGVIGYGRKCYVKYWGRNVYTPVCYTLLYTVVIRWRRGENQWQLDKSRSRTGGAVALLYREHARKKPFMFCPNCNGCIISVALLLLPKRE